MDASPTPTLESLTAEGRTLLTPPRDPIRAHDQFLCWVDNVASYCDLQAPGTGLSAKWSALPISPLVRSYGLHDHPNAWMGFSAAVRDRLSWLGSHAPALLQRRTPQTPTVGKSAFVVHGHDELAAKSVADFLRRIQIQAVILHECPNAGRTVIEKFEEHASAVGFAVVILTPDDRGGPVQTQSENYQPRARQNVILELGFFLAALGRSRVCALHTPGVEIPSDYAGVLYIPYAPDSDWKLRLAREIKTVGLPCDLNLAV